jgi:hypothetical protein
MTVSPVAPAFPPELREALRKAQQPPGWIAPELARLRAKWEAERKPAELTPAALGETRLARAAYRAHNTWCWAKEQLRILGEMAKDRASDRSQGGRLSIGWLAGEVERIRAGVELLPDGLLVEPLAEREPAPEALRAAVGAALQGQNPPPGWMTNTAVVADAVLSSLARFRWESALRERALREVMERIFEQCHVEGHPDYPPGDPEVGAGCEEIALMADAALARPPSADAAALAELAALPAEMARCHGWTVEVQRLANALRTAGLEPAP